MCTEMTQHNDVHEYIALGILDGFISNPYALDNIF